jgi:hypothetical protein
LRLFDVASEAFARVDLRGRQKGFAVDALAARQPGERTFRLID